MRLSWCLQLLSINAMDPLSLLFLHTVTSHSNSERTTFLTDSVLVHVYSSVRTGNPHPHGNHFYQLAAAAAKALQSCLTLCDPRDGRLCPPLDSPGKNTGVGCHFLLQCVKSEKWKWSPSVRSDSMWPHRQQPTRLLCPWDFPGKNTGVGCHCLLLWPT